MPTYPRSYLYVPGDQEGKLARALERGADAIIVDLEDAVPASGKSAARALLREWIVGKRDDGARTQIWVRVNGGSLREIDVAACATMPGLAGLCLAKVEDADEVAAVDSILSRAGSDLGVVPLLESAAAVLAMRSIAKAPRVCRLQLGEADLRAELGIGDAGDEALACARSALVMVSAAAALAPPAAPTSTDFVNLEALRMSTAKFKDLGFWGRTCIHPAQIAVVNDVFTPSAAEIDNALRIVADFDRNAGAAHADASGRMADAATVRSARRLLAIGDDDSGDR